MERGTQAVKLRIYLGEDKGNGDDPLYRRIIGNARASHMAGATILRGTQGYGHSTRLHTVEVLFSEDLPVVIEMIDTAEKIDSFLQTLAGLDGIGLITREEVTIPNW